jgi:transposase
MVRRFDLCARGMLDGFQQASRLNQRTHSRVANSAPRDRTRGRADGLRLERIDGVGPITVSTSISDPRDFKSGRQVGAETGLVPA